MNTPLLLLAAAIAAAALLACADVQAGQVTVVLDERLGPLEIDKMALGQGGLSEEPMWDSRVAEIRALRPRLIRLFCQEYFDLLPQRGRYHFDTLDRSVDTILKTGAKPLMAICFKPRVLFPKVDQDVVEPSDYGEWDKLIYRLVRHYRKRGSGIRYWEVGNEPDIGESGGCPYRFRPDSYNRYYQHTARAVLKADPDALVGGPALASAHSPILPALLRFCQDGKAPLHFVSWHIYSSDPRAIRGTIDHVKSLLRKHPRLKPETFLDEWNMSLGLPPRDPRIQPCFLLETIRQMKDAGLDYSCYYHIRDWHVSFETFRRFLSPGGTAFMCKWWNRKAQFDGLFDYQNAVRPSYFAFKLLSRLTGERLRLTSDVPAVRGLATWDEVFHVYSLLLWNYSSSPAEAELVLSKPPGDLRLKPVTLDAASAGSDENSRLRPGDPIELKRQRPRANVRFGPYGVRFYTIERR
jgi:hypothetical protein